MLELNTLTKSVYIEFSFVFCLAMFNVYHVFILYNIQNKYLSGQK